MKSDVQTKPAIAVGTSTAAPATAPTVHATPHGRDEDRVERKGLFWTPVIALDQFGQRDAVGLLGKRRRNRQRLAFRSPGKMGRKRCRVERKARGDGGDTCDDRCRRHARQPQVADHKLTAARHKRGTQGKDHPGLHPRLRHNHSARRTHRYIGEHHRPNGFNNSEHHIVPRSVKPSTSCTTAHCNRRPPATEFAYNCHRIEQRKLFRKSL